MNKKALISGIFAIMVILFTMAIFSGIAFFMWNKTNETFQSMNNETVTPEVKQKIDDYTNKFIWADKVFMVFYVMLLIGYIISALVTPTENPIFLIAFLILLIVATIVSMFLSNAWTWIIGAPLSSISQHFGYTNFFMKNLPLITFFTGVIGAVVFYGRKRTGGLNAGSFE